MARDVLDHGALDDAMLGLEQHWAGHRDHALPGAGKHCADWMPGDGDGTRNNEYISLQNNLVSRLAWSPAIGEIAACAAGSSVVRLRAAGYWTRRGIGSLRRCTGGS